MNDKNITKRLIRSKMFPYLLLSLAAGLVLMLFPKETSSKTDVKRESVFEYTAYLESEIESLIERIDGVDGCKVMVFSDESFSYLYASDQEVDQDGEKRSVSKKIVFSKLDSEERPIIIEEYLPSISGVAVVIDQNVESFSVKIKNLLSVLLDLDESRIFVTS